MVPVREHGPNVMDDLTVYDGGVLEMIWKRKEGVGNVSGEGGEGRTGEKGSDQLDLDAN